MGELWAWPSALKLALVEHLRTRADILATSRAHRLDADRLVDALETPAPCRQRWPSQVHPAFVIRLLQRSREHPRRAAALRARARRRAARARPDDRGRDPLRGAASGGRAGVHGQPDRQPAPDRRPSTGANSSRASASSSRCFNATRPRCMHAWTSPAAIATGMRSKRLAEPTGEAQVRVALKCVERARQVAERSPDAREAHVGYYLIGAGRRQFERGIGWEPGLLVRLQARVLPARDAVATWARSPSARRRSSRRPSPTRSAHGWQWPMLIVVALLTVVPASELTIQIAAAPDRLVRSRRGASRGSTHAQIPDSARTMVIIPTILDSVARARDLAEHVEVQALGNLDPHIHFAILSDFKDAETETLPLDDEILAAAADAIRALNAKHADGGPDRFFLFHRSASVERTGRALDGVGAQAREDRRVQPAAPWRHRYELRPERRRRVDPAAGALLHHARQRHATAARRRPAADRHHHPSAEPAVVRSGASAGSPRATASSSRASASRSRALPARCSRGCTRVTPASTRTPPPSPIPTRTCSARASSPGRACTTSTRSSRRSKIRFRRTRCCRTTCSKACMRASRSSPTSSSSTSIRRACSRTPGASTGGFAATGRSCCGSSPSCRRATVSSGTRSR